MRLRHLAVAAAAVTAASLPAPAGATTIMVVDPAGDATGPANVVQPLIVPPLPSDPSVDIISAGIDVTAGELLLSTTVVELNTDAPARFDGRRYYYSVNHGGGRLTVDLDAGPGYEQIRAVYYSANYGSAEIPATGELDPVTDTVTVAIGLDALNDAISEASEGHDIEVGPRSRFHSVSAQTYYSRTLALPYGSYPLGLYNTDVAQSDAVYEVPA